ncbi:hypothetical protein F5Y10DRAFT_288633 [Nemania abortiva]|nr:hypothetical protein F5Y10DRAFT_288633 [Nemania abortiva]
MEFADKYIDPQILAADDTSSEVSNPLPVTDETPMDISGSPAAGDTSMEISESLPVQDDASTASSFESAMADIFAELPQPMDNYPIGPLLPGWKPDPPIAVLPSYQGFTYPYPYPQQPPMFPTPAFQYDYYPYPQPPMVSQPYHSFPAPQYPMMEATVPPPPVPQPAREPERDNPVVSPTRRRARRPNDTNRVRKPRAPPRPKRKYRDPDAPLGLVLDKPISEMAADMPEIIPFDIDAYVLRGPEERMSRGKIGRPLNPFLLYRKTWNGHARKLSQATNHNDQAEVSRILGDSYRKETPEVKARFQALYLVEKAMHQQHFPGWKYAPKRPKKKAEKEDEDEDDFFAW